MQELLSMQNVIKYFDGNLALKDGRIEVNRSEIHALIGANGAGKSTLMNILYGLLTPDGGTIRYNGKNVKFRHISDANSAGIFMIHQELNVVRDLTVAQNIFLGREIKKGLAVDDERMNAESALLLEKVGLKVDPAEKMCDLSPAQQQLVEIASILSKDLKLLILDEPTTALGDEDVKTLFELMRSFKAKGISVIYISHRLDELFEISDKITVMRDGGFVVCENTADMTKDKLIYYMTGRTVSMQAKEKSGALPDAPNVLEVKNLNTAEKLKNISFSLKKGEILGFAGLMGSGRTEVARAICGLDPVTDGEIYVNGKKEKIKSAVDAIKLGMGYISENRIEESIIKGKNVIFNTAVNSLDNYVRFNRIDDESLTRDAIKINSDVGTVTSDYASYIEDLSGGNMQKVIIARALMKNLQIFIFDEPTKGIDVGAKEDIYAIINRLAGEGHSVIVISSETDEIRTLCDRVLVMYEGAIAGEINAGDVSPEKIMYYAAGLRGDRDE